jgi:MFS transporter, DHA2 family, multidrug resistance protein
MKNISSNKWLLTLTVMLGTMMNAIDTSIVNVAIPYIKGNLGASVEEISWVITGYILSNVIIMPLIAMVSARIGRRNFYLTSVIVFTAGSLLCGLATNLPLLVFARVLQGIGGGALGPLSQSIMRESFPAEQQGTAMGIFGLGVVVGPALGPTLGGWLVDHFSWPWIFYINIPLGILNVVMVLRYLHDPPYLERERGRMDLAGLALLITGLGALQIVLEQGERRAWFDSGIIISLATLALVGMALFVYRELTVDRPAVDLTLLRDRNFASGVLISGLLGMGLYSSMFLLPLFLQQLLGYSAFDAGLTLMPRSVAMGLTLPVAGRLYNRLGPRILVSTGLTCSAVSFVLMSRMSLDSGYADLFLTQALQGIGFGMTFVSVSTTALASIERRKMMAASGLYNVFRQVFGSVGVAVAATLFTRGQNSNRALLMEHVSRSNPAALTWMSKLSSTMASRGTDLLTARAKASGLLENLVMRQAAMLSFNRIFFLMAFLFVIAFPLVLLLRKQGGAAVVEAAID